jgi:hypothetical protein
MAVHGRMRRRGGIALVAALVLVVGAAGSASATAPQALSWTRTAPPAMAGAIVRDVTSNAGVLLAVGSAELGAGIWRSRDAVHWSSVDLGAIGQDVILLSATAWRQGFAAVGVHYTFLSTGIQRDAVVLTSADGRHWHRADLPGGHTAFPNAVAVHNGVLVAGGCLGVVRRFGCLFAADAQAVAWTSADGRTWTQRLLPDGEHSFVNAIASVGGELVLVGSEVSVDDTGFPTSTPVAVAIWEGTTATSAKRILSDALDSGIGNGVVAHRGTYLVVGGRGACIESWKRDPGGWTPADDVSAACDQQMTDAVAFHGTVYATGFKFIDEGLPVWRTRDTTQWTSVTATAFTSDGLIFEGAALLEWHGRLLIAGTAFSDASADGQIWLGTPGG